MSADKNAAAEARRTYLTQWRRKHPDKIREYNLRYWMKKAGKDAADQQKPENSART